MELSNHAFPLLSLLLLFPLFAGLALFALRNDRWARAFALAAAGVELAIALAALFQLRPATAGMQLVERHAWIPSLNIEYLLGVDGVSAPFLPMTALLALCVVLASWTNIHTLPRLYFALLLWLEAIVMGVFCALDLGLFFLFWELTLPPIYFLVSLWGVGPLRRYAANQYTFFMLAGGVPLLFGFMLLALNHAQTTDMAAPGGLSFDYLALLESSVSPDAQAAIFLLLLAGFAVKSPLFPFHIWLPTTALESPIGVAALLLGPKLGLYGIIRFAIPLAPQAAQAYSGLLAGLGVVGALYGGLIALRQTNLRRLLAYSSISHVGLVMIGISAFNIQGIQGAVFQLLNFGIVSGGMFLIAGFIQHRLGSNELNALGGLARSMPRLASLFFVLGLAEMGVPGTNGFAAEHLIVLGAFKSHIGVGLVALIGAIVGAAYFLGFYRAAFLGPAIRRGAMEAVDLRPRELCIASTLVFLALMGGLLPQCVLDFSQKPLQAWIKRLESGPTQTLAMAHPVQGDRGPAR